MALLGNIGRAGVGAVAGGAKTAAGAAALGTGAFLRQAASPIPGGAAAMTAALGVAGAIGSGALSGFRKGGGAGGNGKDSGSGGGAMVGGLEKLQEGINKLIKINEVGFKDVAIMKNVLIDMRNKAYEDARSRLKNIQGPPVAPTLAAAVDNNKTTSDEGSGFGLGGLAKAAAALAALALGALAWAEGLKDKWKAFTDLKLFAIFSKEGRLYKFFGPGGTLSKFFGPKGTLATMADDIKTFMKNNMMTRVLSRFGNLINSVGKFIDDMFEKLPKPLRPPRLTPKPIGNPLIDEKPKPRQRYTQKQFRQGLARGDIKRTGFKIGPQFRDARGFIKNPFQTSPTNTVANVADDIKPGRMGTNVPNVKVSGLLSGKSKILDTANRVLMGLINSNMVTRTLFAIGQKLALPVFAIFQGVKARKLLENQYMSDEDKQRELAAILGETLGSIGLGIAGTILGGPVGGIAGSLLGYYGGDDVGRFLFDQSQGKKPAIDPKLMQNLTGSGSFYARQQAESTGLLQAMTSGVEGGQGELVGKFMAMRNQAHTDLAADMGIKNVQAASLSNRKFIDAKAAIDADILEQYNKALAVTPSGGANGGTTINNINNNNINGGEGGNGGDVNIETMPANISSNQQDNHDPYGAMA